MPTNDVTQSPPALVAKTDSSARYEWVEQCFARGDWITDPAQPATTRSNLRESTKKTYRNHVRQIYADLHELGAYFRSRDDLTRVPLYSLCAYWASQGCHYQVVRVRLLALSAFFGLVTGAKARLKPAHHYDRRFPSAKDYKLQNETPIPTREEIDRFRDAIVARAMAEDEIFGHMVLVACSVGLKAEAVIHVSPLTDFDSDSARWFKAARKRANGKVFESTYLSLDQTRWHWDALLRVTAFMKRRGPTLEHGTIGWSGARPDLALGGLKGDLARYRRLCRKVRFRLREVHWRKDIDSREYT